MEEDKRKNLTSIVNAVCNVITTIIMAVGTAFMIWWLWQMLLMLVTFD